MEMTNDVFFIAFSDGNATGMMFFQQRPDEDPSKTAARYIKAFERGCGFEIGSIDYELNFLTELTSPCYLSKKTCFQLYQNASEALHENTTNNRTLAEVVMELAGLRCGEIELDDEI